MSSEWGVNSTVYIIEETLFQILWMGESAVLCKGACVAIWSLWV